MYLMDKTVILHVATCVRHICDLVIIYINHFKQAYKYSFLFNFFLFISKWLDPYIEPEMLLNCRE